MTSQRGSPVLRGIGAVVLLVMMAATAGVALGGTKGDTDEVGTLRQAAITTQREPGQWIQYQVPFYDTQGIVRLTAIIRISLIGDDLYETRISFSHTTGTRIDAFRLEFDFPQLVPPFALRTPPGAPWPSLQFQSATEFQGVVVEASGLGFVGAGVLTIEQVLGPVATPEWLTETFQLRLAVELEELSPTDPARFHADGALAIEVP